MLSNLKLTSKNKQNRILKSDNRNTYFTISDNFDLEDGLWSYGFHVFNGIFPDDANNKIEYKSLYPSYININYSKKYNLNLFLFHTGKGFLIEFFNKNIISLGTKKYCVVFKINTEYEIIEKNIKNLVLEYTKPDKKGFVYKKLYVSISSNLDYNIYKTEHTDENLILYLEPSEKTGKDLRLYFRYNNNYDELKNELDKNLVNYDNLKEEIKDNNVKNTKNLNLEDKIIGKALNWAQLASDNFIMFTKEDAAIWAGFPWFNNIWGRDTFISLTGICLSQGKYEYALKILKSIIKYQCKDNKSSDFGKLPNVVFAKNEILYNSSDSTPLFIRSIYEYYLFTGDIKTVSELWENIESAVNVYFNNKNDDHLYSQGIGEDWMDAKVDEKSAYSKRGIYTVEVQSLWYTALQCMYKLAKEIYKKDIKISEKYIKESEEIKKAFTKYFIKDCSPYIIDSLDENKNAIDNIRPNGLLAVYYSELPGISKLFDKKIQLSYLNFIVPELIFEHGVSTLNKNDKYFHPKHIHENYNKDESYHSGCIWPWLSGAFISLCCKFGLENFCFKQTENLSNIMLEKNTLGTLGELIDPYIDNETGINECGAFSQAWSVSEYLRSFVQDYIGIKFNFPKRKIYISPSLPEILENIKTVIKFGRSEKIQLSYRLSKKTKRISQLEIKGLKVADKVNIFLKFRVGEKIKNDNKYIILLNIKCCMQKSEDSIRINFDSVDDLNVKIKEINTYGNSELKYVDYKKEDVSILNNKIEYCKNITVEEFNKMDMIIQKK